MTDKKLKKGIQQASPLSQTSCLEGFHSVLNQFAPKMIAYTYPGMYIRHKLSIQCYVIFFSIFAILQAYNPIHIYIFFNIRHIIAAIHFNQNLNRKAIKNPDGSEQHVVVYPKFKNGEATVRDVKVAANYCKYGFF